MNSIAEQVVQSAAHKGIRIATAESVTGGMISSALTSVPGASRVFACGMVAYGENVKIHSLGVDIDEIRATHGYSEKTARQMAEHILLRNSADVAVSTTGCAGPEFADGFENGRVLIAVARKGQETVVYDERFGNDRAQVRERATEFALQKMAEVIEQA